jgi:hypothetical protein
MCDIHLIDMISRVNWVDAGTNDKAKLATLVIPYEAAFNYKKDEPRKSARPILKVASCVNETLLRRQQDQRPSMDTFDLAKSRATSVLSRMKRRMSI